MLLGGSFRGKRNPPLQVEHHHRVRRGLDQCPVLGFALPECLFRLFAIRNVAMGTYESACFPSCVTHDEPLCEDPTVRAIFVTQAVLGCSPCRRACQEVVLELDNRLTFIRVKKARPILNAFPDLVLFITEYPLPAG